VAAFWQLPSKRICYVISALYQRFLIRSMPDKANEVIFEKKMPRSHSLLVIIREATIRRCVIQAARRFAPCRLDLAHRFPLLLLFHNHAPRPYSWLPSTNPVTLPWLLYTSFNPSCRYSNSSANPVKVFPGEIYRGRNFTSKYSPRKISSVKTYRTDLHVINAPLVNKSLLRLWRKIDCRRSTVML